MGNAVEKLNADIARIGAEAARIAVSGGHRSGEVQVRGRNQPTAVDNLNTRIAEIGAEAARIQANSAECLWVCRHESRRCCPIPTPGSRDQPAAPTER